ncbi:alpha-L-fucosidase [Chitinophaga ginsengisegetis]|uniref:alpha-L-fucosidase n=1 Tax=Chitinophaga ginsengisegetis TaxID=393003 RepID=UPI000DBA0931|nr:alpha-L-fucosidase [Chitinophaga ginsengisegetis]MDR6567054.1 alpha-L-fucosidase [Chitinophaga ginsengisegetis]MDR6646784.1 alpha-L-fucosidase [Chitinophaga ginsengisegetis]MDR6653134.1 alpha-L-fucosidase [Chitinophaga ginsengisegetis]
MKRLLVLVAFAMQLLTAAHAQQKTNPDDIKEKMQWFSDAKLGIFIHWGIYSVKGIDESWSFHNKKISYPDYMQQLKGFTANNYNPQAWADLIKESGARYAVMTTKHHDGVALWDSKYSKLDVVNSTPAKRDVLTPFYAALRRDSIKCGAYFSLIDWSHNDYPQFLKDSNRYEIKAQPERWQRFLKYYEGQMAEVMTKFNPDLWWFDGDWEHSAEEWEAPKMRQMLTSHNPNTIINGRLQGYGDYETPEQNFPVSRPKYHWWELCMTINNNWGWQPQDNNWKTPFEIITIFVDAVSNGGNLLLDIGPKADGSIPEEEVHMLKELGAWNKRNGEAVFNTIGGIPQGHFYGPTTLSKDSSTLYLFLPAKTSGQVMVKGLSNKIESITVLGNNSQLTHKVVGKISWSPVPGLVFIDVPENVHDKYITVLKVKLDKAVKLYRGQGGFLTND